MCNNSLFEDHGAENLPGLKYGTEDADFIDPRVSGMVGEHSMCAEAGLVRVCGAHGRENVGMSNRKADEKSAPRKSKGSSATEIGGG